jgi:hypothetical protein
MGEYSKSLPEQVRKHLRALTKSAGLDDLADADEQLARGWHAKHQAFRNHTENHEMVTAEYFQSANPGGALAMTFSGSILSVGPIVDGGRAVAYASIGIRQDVPQMSISQNVQLTADLKRGESATFDAGSIQQTSPIFAIAIFQRALDPLDEKNALAEITDLLAEQFVAINQETVSVQG